MFWQSDAQEAKEQAEAQAAELERTARRKHEELDRRAARLEAQLHQQALDTDDYRRRSEAEARRQQQVLQMAEQARRYIFCGLAVLQRVLIIDMSMLTISYHRQLFGL